MSRIFLVVLALTFSSANNLFGQGLFETALQSGDSSKQNPQIFNGFIRSAIYGSYPKDKDEVYIQSLYSQFGLSANIETGNFGSAFAEIRYRTGIEYNERISEAELREAYVNLYIGPLTIKAGKQITSWGESSFLNPTDQFSPKDPTFRSPNLDDLRIGNWGIQSNLFINTSSSIVVLWMPSYRPSVLLTKPFDFPEYIEFKDFDLLETRLNKSNYALKYDLRTSAMDIVLSYYNGYRNNPAFKMDTVLINFTDLTLDKIRLYESPYRIQTAGLNLTVPFGSNIMRLEAAWTDPLKEEEAMHPLPEISYAFELEQAGQNASFIAGYYGKYILDYIDDGFTPIGITSPITNIASLIPAGSSPDLFTISTLIDQQIGGFNKLIDYQQKEFYHSIYATIRFSINHEFLDVNIPVMYNITAGELTLMPSLKFNISDGLSFQLGAYYLHGKENSIYDIIGPRLNAGYGLLELKF